MADAARLDIDDSPPPRRAGRSGLIAGVVMMAALGAGGFYATFTGMVAMPFDGARTAAPATVSSADVSFVSLEPLTVSLGPAASARHLRLTAALEVTPGAESEVRALMPRILDVMNTYLQALDEGDVDRPAAMSRMRAHLVRRIRIVTGEDRVRDLLITEFVLQ